MRHKEKFIGWGFEEPSMGLLRQLRHSFCSPFAFLLKCVRPSSEHNVTLRIELNLEIWRRLLLYESKQISIWLKIQLFEIILIIGRIQS